MADRVALQAIKVLRPVGLDVGAFGFSLLSASVSVGLKNSAIARLVLGDSFAWMDILSYIIGIAIVIWIGNVSGHLLKPGGNKMSQAKMQRQ